MFVTGVRKEHIMKNFLKLISVAILAYIIILAMQLVVSFGGLDFYIITYFFKALKADTWALRFLGVSFILTFGATLMPLLSRDMFSAHSEKAFNRIFLLKYLLLNLMIISALLLIGIDRTTLLLLFFTIFIFPLLYFWCRFMYRCTRKK